MVNTLSIQSRGGSSLCSGPGDGANNVVHGGPQRVHVVTADRGDRDNGKMLQRSARQVFFDLRLHQFQPLCINQIGLGYGHQALFDTVEV